MPHLRYAPIACALALGCADEPRPLTRPDAGAVADVVSRIDATPADAPSLCVAGTIYCDADTQYTCDEAGAVVDRRACAAPAPLCFPGRGCLACAPNSARCDPADPRRVQTCRADGSGYTEGPRCEAEGETCNAGVCVDRCSDSALGNSYLGCDYWPTVTVNSGLNPVFQYAVVLTNPQTYPVRATITGGALAAPREVQLSPGQVETVILPWVYDLAFINPDCIQVFKTCIPWSTVTSNLRRGGAYHVRSNGPITAYQFNPLTFSSAGRFSYTNDASLLLPQGVLSQRYTVVTWPNFPYTPDGDPPMTYYFGGFASVVAVTGETTTVTVRAASPLRAGPGVPAMRANETRTFQLQPGDVLQLVGADRGDITGTTIESSERVAVFVGHDCTNVPLDNTACDHLEEQLLPNETWGREYVVSGLRDRGATVASQVRLVSRVDGNALTFDPPSVHAPVTLGAGQVLDFATSQHFVVRGTGAFLPVQFMRGQGYDRTMAGDPAMVQEVPVEQYRTSYDFTVPATYVANFINVVTPVGGALEMDGQALRGSSSEVAGFTVYTLPIAPGNHRLSSPGGQGIGLKVYGVAPYTSYMYPGGLDLRRITPG
ncbi:MAG: hypothetical protein JWM10_374 [Myxococcaceae bacterium]|nr:hypothetical protein [Myxococcaceae bacterium]